MQAVDKQKILVYITMYDIMQKATISENIHQVVLAISGCGDDALADVISVNAGSMIYLSRKARSSKEGYCLAKKSIVSGQAYNKLKEIIEVYEGSQKRNSKMFGIS